MAEPDRGPEVDQSSLLDDEVLERELREALKSEGEIELFKIVNRGLRVTNELANSEITRLALGSMWSNVADFFELIVEAPTLAALPADHKLVAAHARMRANFDVVSLINNVIKDSREATQELRAVDDMSHEIEDPL